MSIIFEHPLNELVRSFLRIERLFAELDRSLRFSEDKNTVLMLMCSIMRLLERPDLKSKLTNYLHQQYLQLEAFSNNPSIEQERLEKMLARIDTKLKLLKSNHTLTALMPCSHELIKKYQTEMMSHGATALIVEPIFSAWDQLSSEDSTEILSQWRLQIEDLHATIQLAVELMRLSQPFQTIECNSSFYSKSINFDYSLIRMKLPKGIQPELSAGRHHVAIRFKKLIITSSGVKIVDTELNKFDIAYCI